jgi:hypothetical protein
VRQLRRIPPQGFRRVCLFGGLATLRRKYNPGRFLDVDQGNLWVRLDKSEGAVKDKEILRQCRAPLALPERLRTKALEISR